MPERFAAASFERFRGWLVRGRRAKLPAAAIVGINAINPQGGRWTSDLWRIRLGGTRAPEPFLGVTASNYATTQQTFVLRSKTHSIHNVRY